MAVKRAIDTPSLTDDVIRDLWERASTAAHREAQAETGIDFPRPPLAWKDVFETAYTPDH
jgi:hypothetical protein